MKFTKDNILRILLIVGAIAIVVWALPHKDKFSYDYELGRPWSYSLLTAPFDLPMNRDSVTAKKMKDSIDRAFIKIYRYDNSIPKKNISNLKNVLYANTNLTAGQRGIIVGQIQKLYNSGIVDNDSYEQIRAGKMPIVKFIVNNVATQASTSGMVSPHQAYNYLDSVLPEQNYREAMNSVGITDYLTPNIVYDNVKSKSIIDQIYQKALAPTGVVQKGERIIDRGDIVTPQTYDLLKTYEKMMNDRNLKSGGAQYGLVGQIAMEALIFISLFLFLYFFRSRVFNDIKKMTFLMTLIVAFIVLSFLFMSSFKMAVYFIPFAIIPIITTTFFDSRVALFAEMVEVLTCSLVVTMPAEFIFMQFMAGVTAIVSIQELSKRSQLAQCAFYIFVAYCLTFTSLAIIKDGNVNGINLRIFGYFAANAVLLSFAYVLIFVIEKMFGFTSSVTLVELTDVNNPVLRELSEKCPGTFQHSLQVSNLAAEAARNIGANVQLARAGALYHDIGKIDNPAFFTENQRGVNPHNALKPEQSAKIVISHVADGVKRADKAKLPAIIKAFIQQHHGFGKAKYFYTQACNANPDAKIDVALFTYPGPNPQTKETAITMMADGTEAASKSLTDHSDEAIKGLVNKIINTQIADGLLEESPLSFRDVKIIKRTFSDRLSTFYHTRVQYPDAVERDDEEKGEDESIEDKAEEEIESESDVK
jgi:putative nucleotidyltransferase with HDIG domain